MNHEFVSVTKEHKKNYSTKERISSIYTQTKNTHQTNDSITQPPAPPKNTFWL